MAFQVPQFWDIAGDGFQIILCMLMLCFFIKNRAIQRKSEVNKKQSEAGQSFNTHVFSITVEQQINQAFTNIIETIAAERNGLENMLGLNPLNHEDNDISMVRASTRVPNSHGNNRLSDDRTGCEGRHDKVRKFAAKGLNAEKISRELKIPLSEVELILSLQGK